MPALHKLQDVEPTLSAYDPLGHALQLPVDSMVALRYVPTSQGSHSPPPLPSPTTSLEPSWHPVQAVLLVAPLPTVTVPLGQGVHSPCPASEKVLQGQDRQVKAPLEKVPGGQGEHWARPADCATAPGGQGEHTVDPAGEKVPGGQM